MATYGPDTRNAVAAAIALVLSGAHLYLLTETGLTLAAVPFPSFTSPTEGVLEAVGFPATEAIATGEPRRYEVRRGSGSVLLSGSSNELTIRLEGMPVGQRPPTLMRGGRVFVDGFLLTV